MNPLQIMQMLQSANNPLAMMQSITGNNPMFQQAMKMGQGKNPVQIKQTIRNLAKERGMSDDQLNQFVAQFGLKMD